MKLIVSGVANCAASVRSPSFSRSSSSQTTTILPGRMSSIASSIVAKGVGGAGALIARHRQQALHVLGEHVDLKVNARALARVSPSVRPLERLRDQRDGEAVARRSALTVRLTPSTATEPFSTT